MILASALVLGAALLGASVAWLVLRNRAERAFKQGRADREDKISDLKGKISALEQKAQGLESQLEEVKARQDELSETVGEPREEKSTLETENKTFQSGRSDRAAEGAVCRHRRGGLAHGVPPVYLRGHG